jgi:hypothetical protein
MSKTTSHKLDYIKTEFPGALINPTINEVRNLKMVVYLLIVDDQIVVVGHASGFDRFRIIFPGISAPSHQKAFIAAMATLTAKQSVVRIVIPVSSKKYVKMVESDLIKLFEFHKQSVKSKSKELFLRRCADLNIDFNSISKTYIAFLQPVFSPQGSEVGGWKKDWMDAYDDVDPSFRGWVHNFFGNHFTDI